MAARIHQSKHLIDTMRQISKHQNEDTADFVLRAYPKTSARRYVMIAQAK